MKNRTPKIGFPLILFFLLAQIASANTAPTLSSDYHTPSWGYPGTNFTFTITYTDLDGDPPSYVKVYIQPPNTEYSEDMGYEMAYAGGSYTTGATYNLTWTATSNYTGSLNHYYEASDGTERANKPTYGGSCTPGDCPTCCGDLGGPTVFSAPIDDCGIYLFRKESATPVWSYETGDDWVDNVAISEDGNYLAANTYKGAVYLFSKENASPLWIHNESCEGIGSVAISENGNYVAASTCSSIRLFTPANNTPIWSYLAGATISTVSISSDGRYVAAGSHNNKLYLFSNESNETLWTYEVVAVGGEGGGADVISTAVSADGSYIAAGTGCPDRSLYLFHRNGSTPLWTRKISTNSPVESISMSEDGSYMLVGDGGPDDPTGIYFLSRESNESLWSYVTNGSVNSVSISSDGSLMTAQKDSKMYLFSRESNTPVWNHTSGSTVASVAISKDGSYIASGSADRNVRLFQSTTSTPLWNYKADEWVMSTSISGDGSFIAAGTGASTYISLENPGDMNYGNATCGDTICEGDETYETCPEDCMGEGCELAGDYDPCGEVTLSEVVSYINLWSTGEAALAEVISLINAWAS